MAARVPDVPALAGTLATLAIAALGGGLPSAGFATLREGVRHAETVLRGHGQATQVQRTVGDSIHEWAQNEHLTDVTPGLELATRIVLAYGATGRDRARLNYGPTAIRDMVWEKAREDRRRFGELTTSSQDPAVVVAHRAVLITYGALNRQLGTTEPLHPGLIELLERATAQNQTLQQAVEQLTEQGESLQRHGASLDRIEQGVNRLNRRGRDAPAGPVVVGNIPLAPAGHITRDQVSELVATLADSGVGVVCASVTGMRGVGKTHVAAAYARDRLAAGWDLVAWVDAERPDNLLAGLAAVAKELGVEDPAGDSQVSAARVHAHLQARTTPALLVFDNATDPNLVRHYLPGAGATRAVITSTETAFARLGTVVKVETFTPNQAKEYLIGQTGVDDPGGAAAVAEELGHLPVALAQAAAVITGPPAMGYAEFLDELTAVPVEETLGAGAGHDYPRSVAATFLLSIRAIENAADRAGDVVRLTTRILQTSAVLSPDGISPDLYTGLLNDPDDPAQRRQLRAALHRVTNHWVLAPSTHDTIQGDTQMYGGPAAHKWVMHRLIARVLRDRQRTYPQASGLLIEALGLLMRYLLVWQEDPHAHLSISADELGAHVEALWTASSPLHTITIPPEVEPLLRNLLAARNLWANHLQSRGDFARTSPLADDILAHAERLFGPQHQMTLGARVQVATTCLNAGDSGKAVAEFERVLADLEATQSPGHPSILTTRNNLASAYTARGRPEDAVKLYEQNAPDLDKAFGAEHPYTLTATANLGRAYREAGRLADAIRILEETYRKVERTRGGRHPDTLTARDQLAGAFQDAERLDAALALFEQTLEERRAVLGDEHPDVQTSGNNLALAYHKAGRLPEAIALFEQTLTRSQDILGVDHPNTLTTCHNLALCYHTAGERAKALHFMKRALAGRERVLGPEHPHTRALADNLATVRQEMKKIDEDPPANK